MRVTVREREIEKYRHGKRARLEEREGQTH